MNNIKRRSLERNMSSLRDINMTYITSSNGCDMSTSNSSGSKKSVAFLGYDKPPSPTDVTSSFTSQSSSNLPKLIEATEADFDGTRHRDAHEAFKHDLRERELAEMFEELQAQNKELKAENKSLHKAVKKGMKLANGLNDLVTKSVQANEENARHAREAEAQIASLKRELHDARQELHEARQSETRDHAQSRTEIARLKQELNEAKLSKEELIFDLTEQNDKLKRKIQKAKDWKHSVRTELADAVIKAKEEKNEAYQICGVLQQEIDVLYGKV